MADASSKVVLMLAASDLHSAEIRLFLKAVERAGSANMLRLVEDLRELAGEDGSPERRQHTSRDPRLDEHGDLIRKLENLLLVEAQLPKVAASQILHVELVKEFGNRYYIPAPNKIAFKLWLARLLDQVPASAALHAASKIRNNIVHGKKSPSDWPLMSEAS